ncbi:hypothetical protein LEMLEM_LOCUS11469 [Lemmus lemmus]
MREPLRRGGERTVGTRGVETPGEHGLQNQLSRVHGLTIVTEVTITVGCLGLFCMGPFPSSWVASPSLDVGVCA